MFGSWVDFSKKGINLLYRVMGFCHRLVSPPPSHPSPRIQCKQKQIFFCFFTFKYPKIRTKPLNFPLLRPCNPFPLYPTPIIASHLSQYLAGCFITNENGNRGQKPYGLVGRVGVGGHSYYYTTGQSLTAKVPNTHMLTKG